MAIHVELPGTIANAMRFPAGSERQKRILIDLAVSLYVQGTLSFGKARRFCELSKYEFGMLLGQREIPRHYAPEDLKDDLNYVRGQ
jgi:predicted HTH domain antitoxin